MKKSKKQKRKSKNKSKNQLKHKMLYTDKEYKYFLREIENLRGKNLEEITQLRNLIRTRIDSSTKLPVTDLNIAPLWGTDSNLHQYRTKVIHGGEYFTNLYYRIIDWFYNVMSKIDTFTNSLSENFGVKWIVKFFKFFNIWAKGKFTRLNQFFPLFKIYICIVKLFWQITKRYFHKIN